jgi:hypothetical protein
MRFLLALAALLLLAACGSDTTVPDSAGPSGSPSAASPSGRPTAVPSATRPVATRHLATVMDTGSPELCLGPVAESYPPQCHGVPLADWDWADVEGTYEQSGSTRWGENAVTGTFDGDTLTVTRVVPAAAYDPAAPSPPVGTGDAGSFGPKEAAIQAKLEKDPLPGTLTVSPAIDAIVVEVVYDDGSLQAWADRGFGGGAVRVLSALVPAGPATR